MARLAHSLSVAPVEEQFLGSTVRNLVVHVGRPRVAALPDDNHALASLAHVEVAEQCLLPNAVRAAPALVLVKLAVGFGFG